MADAVQQMLENAGMTLEQCEGIGIGSPGTIDAKRGVILYSNNFGWENVPIVEELKKHLDVGIEIANDADAAALGEVYAGAAEGAENAVLLTLGTGVGSGVILDKKIFRGGMPGGCELPAHAPWLPAWYLPLSVCPTKLLRPQASDLRL